MSLSKEKRLKDRKLLDSYRGKPCVGCLFENSTTTAAHIKSRGAGGPDATWNLLPLCFRCHREQHDKGWRWIWDNKWRIREALTKLGWEMTDYGLLRNDEKHND